MRSKRPADIRVEKDFQELLKLFNKHKVRYCVVGAFAVGFHAISRYTKDLDILVEPSRENGEKIVTALTEFGFGSLRLTPDDFKRQGRFVQLGVEPVRVDLITSIDGVGFGRAWKNKKRGDFGNEKAYFIGLKDLIRAKLSARRRQDLADLEILNRALQRDKKRVHR